MDGRPVTHVRRVGVLAEAALALGSFALVALVVTWPVARSPGSMVLGVVDSDSATMIWWLDVLQQHGYELWGRSSFREVAWPFGTDHPNALNIQWAWPYAPAYLLAKAAGPVVAYNVTLLTGLTLSGAAAYALARVVGAQVLVAGWAGLVYVLFPWHVERIVAGHASLIHVECFPLLALALVLLARRRTPARVALLVGATLLCWLTSGYFGVMGTVAAAVAALAWALASPDRRAALRRAAAGVAVVVGVGAVVAGLALASGGDGGVGAARPVSDLERYGLRPIELVVPSEANPVMRRVFPGFWQERRHGATLQESSNAVGLATLALALLWLVRLRRWTSSGDPRRALTAAASAVWAVGFALALPGRVEVLGLSFGWMPSRVLYELVPAFRVPTRWTALIVLATVVLAALGLSELVRRLAPRIGARSPGPVAAALVAAIALVSVVELRATHPGISYDPAALPAEYALLGRVPAGAVAEYPMSQWEDTINGAYVIHQRAHGRPLVNVAPSPWVNPVEGIRRTIVDPSAPGVAPALAALGATAVITRPDTLPRGLDLPLPERAPRLGDGYARVGTTADGATVWRVTAAPAPAVAATAPGDFAAPTLDARGRIVQELLDEEGAIVLWRPGAGPRRRTVVLHLVLSTMGEASTRATVAGRTVTATRAGTAVAVRVVVPADGVRVPVTRPRGGTLAVGQLRVTTR